jgi:hypothetical protein
MEELDRAEEEFFDEELNEARDCETCGRVDAADESGVFRVNVAEGNPRDE